MMRLNVFAVIAIAVCTPVVAQVEPPTLLQQVIETWSIQVEDTVDPEHQRLFRRAVDAVNAGLVQIEVEDFGGARGRTNGDGLPPSTQPGWDPSWVGKSEWNSGLGLFQFTTIYWKNACQYVDAQIERCIPPYAPPSPEDKMHYKLSLAAKTLAHEMEHTFDSADDATRRDTDYAAWNASNENRCYDYEYHLWFDWLLNDPKLADAATILGCMADDEWKFIRDRVFGF